MNRHVLDQNALAEALRENFLLFEYSNNSKTCVKRPLKDRHNKGLNDN